MMLLQALYKRSKSEDDGEALQISDCRGRRWLRWSEIHKLVERTATVLTNLGITSGNRVGVLAENCLEWILVDLACHWLHAVSVPLNTQLSSAQLAQQIDHAGVSLLCASDEFLSLVTGDTRIPTVVLDSDAELGGSYGEQVIGSLKALHARAAGFAGPCHIPGPAPTRVASIVYTSGTTGDAKGVMLTEDNLLFNAEMALKRYQFDANTVQFNFLPFFHAFGRTCDLYVWLLGGHRLSLSASRHQAVQEVATVSPTHINGVPYFFEKLVAECMRNGDAESVLGQTLCQVNSGGAALSEESCLYLQSNGIAVLEGYGLTETSPVATLTGRDDIRSGSVGRALDQTEIKLDSEGEVLIKGRHVCAGYYRDDQATDERICDGWLKTGDLGRIDQQQFLYLTGRKNDLIVTAQGQNIWPRPIEASLELHPAIDQAVVFGDQQKYLVAILVPDWEYFAGQVDISGTPDCWQDSPNV